MWPFKSFLLKHLAKAQLHLLSIPIEDSCVFCPRIYSCCSMIRMGCFTHYLTLDSSQCPSQTPANCQDTPRAPQQPLLVDKVSVWPRFEAWFLWLWPTLLLQRPQLLAFAPLPPISHFFRKGQDLLSPASSVHLSEMLNALDL